MRIVLLVVSFAAGLLAASQFPIEGRVEGPASAPMDRLRVFAAAAGGGEEFRTWVRRDGTFEFRGLPDGVYEFSLVTPDGSVAARETATAPGAMMVTLRLPPAAASGGAISLYRLTHEVPPRAAKAFRKAASASAKGRHEEAVRWLDEAIQIDPGFVEALYRRGQYALKDGHLPQARLLLSQAADLDPSWPALQADAAVAEYAGASFESCERRAAAALRVDPAAAKPNYLRALALLRLGRPPAQVEPLLEKAAPEYPKAAELLGRIRGVKENGGLMK